MPEPTPTYHIDIWTPTPEYVCQVCVPAAAFRGTEDEVRAHVQDVHQAAPIPTPTIPNLLALRHESDLRKAGMAADAAAVQAHGARTAPSVEAPAEERTHG